MTNELRDRQAAEAVHKHYWDLLSEADALTALVACGVLADPERLHAALKAYDGFTHALGATLDPTTVPEAGHPRPPGRPPLTQTPPPARWTGHRF